MILTYALGMGKKKRYIYLYKINLKRKEKMQKYFLIIVLCFYGCTIENINEKYSINQIILNNDKIEYSENITIYFTNPYSNPQMEKDLIQKINNHSISHTLDLCFYGFDRENVIAAIESAINRGIHVRFVGNKDGALPVSSCAGDYYEGYNRIAKALDTAFPVLDKYRVNFPDDYGFDDFNLINNSGIMHNKFALITESTGKKYLYTGTTNCTNTCFTRNNNNSLIISDDSIVETHQKQFEYLLGLPGSVSIDTMQQHSIDGILFEILFSPNNPDVKKPIEYLIDKVNNAQSSIHFMIFSFSHDDLNNQILNRFINGLDVMGIFDESQLDNSYEEFLANGGIPCRIDGNYFIDETGFHGGKLHHKTMIIDSIGNNAVVVTGSFNWSDNANENNDENILFIHSKDIALIYENEFQKRWVKGIDVEKITRGDNAEYQDVIINEVMWMGSRKEFDITSSNDEFIELKNMTDKKINLSAWTIDGAGIKDRPLIISNAYIKPNDFLVIQDMAINDSAFQSSWYYINSTLNISNDKIELTLMDPDGHIIDYAGNGGPGDEFAGYNESGNGGLKKSMARKNIPQDGRIKDNWFTTNTQKNISVEFNYLLYNCATPNANNSSGILTYNPIDVVISEVAWAGTDTSYANEWFELFNNTTNDINLIGWIIGGDLNIHLSGVIPAGRHFLLERTDDDSVPHKEADKIYIGSLNNSGGKISVFYNNNIEIDKIDMLPWSAGSASPRITMERINFDATGDISNWQDGTGDIEGAENSLDE